MSEFICNDCNAYFRQSENHCPNCQVPLIFQGPKKNVTDTLVPNCLVHRYQGSDLLEPAQITKEGKVNMKVAIRLRDLEKPIAIPKREVYEMDPDILDSINALRDERRTTMDHYDDLIGKYWNKLRPFST